jgi:dephospho-CoA kinase
MMTEIVFLIEDDVDGGYIARALGESIFTQADDIENLKEILRDAVRCHFPNEQLRPKVIRLHIVRDEVIAS